MVDLANAVPADKYGWRPGAGVRSVGEVYVHVALANVFLPSFSGAKIPEGFTREMEKTVTDKAKIIDAMKKSFDNLKSFATSASDADLEKKVKIFGELEVSERELMVIILNHMHEHLGQSIAYARMNGVTPPWSGGPRNRRSPPASPRFSSYIRFGIEPSRGEGIPDRVPFTTGPLCPRGRGSGCCRRAAAGR